MLWLPPGQVHAAALYKTPGQRKKRDALWVSLFDPMFSSQPFIIHWKITSLFNEAGYSSGFSYLWCLALTKPSCYSNSKIIGIHFMASKKPASPISFVVGHTKKYFLFRWLGLYTLLSPALLPSLPKSVFFQADISSAAIHVFFLDNNFPVVKDTKSFTEIIEKRNLLPMLHREWYFSYSTMKTQIGVLLLQHFKTHVSGICMCELLK